MHEAGSKETVSVDAIFFDIDGTLIDARKDIAGAMNYVLRRLGLPERSFDDIISYVGTGVKDLIAKSMKTDDQTLIDEGTRIYADRYAAHPADDAMLYPHAREILEYFADKKKFILTNRYAKLAEAVLVALGIREYFEEIVGGDNESCIKPCAGVLGPCISKFGIDKTRSLIVGDMAIDIETGRNIGIRTCWIRHGLGKEADIMPLKPDFVIGDLIELKNIIK